MAIVLPQRRRVGISEPVQAVQGEEFAGISAKHVLELLRENEDGAGKSIMAWRLTAPEQKLRTGAVPTIAPHPDDCGLHLLRSIWYIRSCCKACKSALVAVLTTLCLTTDGLAHHEGTYHARLLIELNLSHELTSLQQINVVLTLFGASSLVGALVADVPGLNGPVPAVRLDSILFGKRRPSDFQHPGIWHTHDDLERIRNGVFEKREPWTSAFDAFSNDSYSLSCYKMQGPKSVISRGPISNQSSMTNDFRAAWQNSLMWYIIKEESHWTKATAILGGWGSNLTSIIGTDRSLLVGLEGQFFVNAAELMRWEGNWTESGASWRGGTGFSVQLYWLFARQSIIVGAANYGMASISGLLSFAVYLDDVAMYNYALDMYQNDLCGGLRGNVDPSTGQSAESGRDQCKR